jgi:hypothetical protein
MFTIEDARRVQSDLGLGHAHVYYVDYDGFVLAHTDAERAVGADLATCPVHRNLCEGTERLLAHANGPGWWSWTPGTLRGLAL